MLILAGILVSLKKRISTSHRNRTLCCRPGPNFSKWGKKTADAAKKEEKAQQTVGKVRTLLHLRRLQFVEEYSYQKKLITRSANLRSSLSGKKTTFAPDGPETSGRTSNFMTHGMSAPWAELGL